MTTRTGALVTAGLLAAAVLTGCSTMNQEWHEGCVIEDKETLYSMQDGKSTRTYRLSTSCGAFKVGDSLAGGFSSWDTWSKLDEGKTYDLKTGGFRVGIFSQFPTVVEVREATR